jgi:hypothetical protein
MQKQSASQLHKAQCLDLASSTLTVHITIKDGFRENDEEDLKHASGADTLVVKQAKGNLQLQDADAALNETKSTSEDEEDPDSESEAQEDADELEDDGSTEDIKNEGSEEVVLSDTENESAIQHDSIEETNASDATIEDTNDDEVRQTDDNDVSEGAVAKIVEDCESDQGLIEKATDVYQVIQQDVEQQISIDDSDKKPAAKPTATNTANEDKLTSGEEAMPGAFGVEIVHELYRLCLQTKPDQDGLTDPSKWEPVRSYLLSSPKLVQQAARTRSSGGLTPFHQVCCHDPPIDIVELFASCVDLDILMLSCQRGMLPLHYACIHTASVEVIDALVQLYPESLVKQNAEGATPLHFAVANTNATVDLVDFVNQVCVERAASATDDKGMLPLHYATMYKACSKPPIVKILATAFPGGLSCSDLKGRVPVRWLAKSCHLDETLDLLEFSFALDPPLGKGDMGLLLLKHLEECARKNGKSDNIQKCLDLLLEHNPDPTEKYVKELKALPRWLKKGERAERKPLFRRLLTNRKKKKSTAENEG